MARSCANARLICRAGEHHRIESHFLFRCTDSLLTCAYLYHPGQNGSIKPRTASRTLYGMVRSQNPTSRRSWPTLPATATTSPSQSAKCALRSGLSRAPTRARSSPRNWPTSSQRSSCRSSHLRRASPPLESCSSTASSSSWAMLSHSSDPMSAAARTRRRWIRWCWRKCSRGRAGLGVCGP